MMTITNVVIEMRWGPILLEQEIVIMLNVCGDNHCNVISRYICPVTVFFGEEWSVKFLQ